MHPRQVPCWITHTNARTHDIIRAGLDRSPLFTGVIEGVGPRYCPSIEDKVVRFAERDSHQIFLEPEGLDTHEIYPNGISTSLPFDVQLALVRSMRGCESAHILRPGYAIEYDYFDPRGAASRRSRPRPSRACSSPARSTAPPATRRRRRRACSRASTRRCSRAARTAGRPRRDEAYLGVLVDDLVTRGVTEPYRMFTSRAEYRLQLREDNADLRLTEHGRRLGVVDDARWDAFCRKRDAIERGARPAGAHATSARRRRAHEQAIACSASRSSASTRSPICCAVPASPTRRCMALAGRGHAGRRRRRRRAGRGLDQVRGLHRAPARRDRRAGARRKTRRCRRTSTTRRCAACRTKSQQKLARSGPRRSARRRASRASRRRRSRCCSCTCKRRATAPRTGRRADAGMTTVGRAGRRGAAGRRPARARRRAADRRERAARRRTSRCSRSGTAPTT